MEQLGQKFSEKLSYTIFTASTINTFSATVWTTRNLDLSRPFKEGVVINNLDVAIEIFDPADPKNPLAFIQAGGNYVFSKTDLQSLARPPLLANNTAGNASSGNVYMLMVR